MSEKSLRDQTQKYVILSVPAKDLLQPSIGTRSFAGTLRMTRLDLSSPRHDRRL